jgi:trimeric autotransporter adhesin
MKLLLVVLLGFATQFASAQLSCSPPTTLLRDSGILSFDEGHGAHVKFKYNGVQTDFNAPNFIVVVPASGTTPGFVRVGLNYNVVAQLQPGGLYSLAVKFVTVDQTPASTAGCPVILMVPKEPPPSITSVVNAASLQPLLSPGASVSILGSHLTGPTLSTNYDDTASYPTSVAGTSVTFNGIAAPLLYVSPGQINAIVPFALAGQTSVQVVVQRFNQVSATVTLSLQDTSPAIFTAAQNGSGQGAILQQGSDGQFTFNSSDNPAPKGAALEIFATGAGVWTPPAQSDVYLSPEPFTTQPVTVMIGGQPAKLLYAGLQGTQATWSVLQVNAVVPDGVGSGPQPVLLKIGANDISQQNVTVWVR